LHCKLIGEAGKPGSFPKQGSPCLTGGTCFRLRADTSQRSLAGPTSRGRRTTQGRPRRSTAIAHEPAVRCVPGRFDAAVDVLAPSKLGKGGWDVRSTLKPFVGALRVKARRVASDQRLEASLASGRGNPPGEAQTASPKAMLLSAERPFVGASAVHIPGTMLRHHTGLVPAVLPASIEHGKRAIGILRNFGDPAISSAQRPEI
jgi:hypothetical protein